MLLLGESGTSKNLFAKAIHQSSSRRGGPFVYINCTSIPENLFESELFGYERGAFSGALSSGKPGLLKNLEELVAKNLFREDLYYRINVFPITIPLLRERPKDIPHLVRFLVPKLCEKLGRKPKHVKEDVMNVLKLHRWRGNVSELENMLERAINVCEGNTIAVSDLPDGFKKIAGVDQLVSVIGIAPLKKTVEQTERQLISKMLDYTGGC